LKVAESIEDLQIVYDFLKEGEGTEAELEKHFIQE
jgi:hypothetical protein